MSYILPGVYQTVSASGIPVTASPRFGSIGVVGHMHSGINANSGAIDDGDLLKFDGNATSGTIYTFNSLIEAINTIGTIPVSGSWTTGEVVGSGSDASCYDEEFNLIRALELIYLANPSARCKVAVLTASGTTASGSSGATGVTTALAALKKENDISFLVGAGMDYNTEFLTGATDHSSDGHERIYVGGTSINRILSGVTLQPDVAEFSSLRAAGGRGINYVVNLQFAFSTEYPSEVSEIREVGGNFMSAYLAGKLSTLSEATSLLKLGIDFSRQVWNTKDFKWDKNAMEDLYSGSFVFAHLKSSGWKYGSSRTYATDGNIHQRITTRRIVDRVEAEKRAIGDIFVGEQNTVTTRNSIKSALDGRLLLLSQQGLINSSLSNRVYINDGDVASGIVRVESVYSPITEIEYVVQHTQINL